MCAGHVGAEPGFVQKHELLRFELGLLRHPLLASGLYVGTILLTRPDRLFSREAEMHQGPGQGRLRQRDGEALAVLDHRCVGWVTISENSGTSSTSTTNHTRKATTRNLTDLLLVQQVPYIACIDPFARDTESNHGG